MILIVLGIMLFMLTFFADRLDKILDVLKEIRDQNVGAK